MNLAQSEDRPRKTVERKELACVLWRNHKDNPTWRGGGDLSPAGHLAHHECRAEQSRAEPTSRGSQPNGSVIKTRTDGTAEGGGKRKAACGWFLFFLLVFLLRHPPSWRREGRLGRGHTERAPHMETFGRLLLQSE